MDQLSYAFAKRRILGKEHHANLFLAAGEDHSLRLDAAERCGLEICHEDQLLSDELLGFIEFCDSRNDLSLLIAGPQR